MMGKAMSIFPGALWPSGPLFYNEKIFGNRIEILSKQQRFLNHKGVTWEATFYLFSFFEEGGLASPPPPPPTHHYSLLLRQNNHDYALLIRWFGQDGLGPAQE